MKSIREHLSEYVAARRALGTRLEEPAQTLGKFVEFIGRKKARFIKIDLALEWAQESPGVQRATWARKLSMVRQFARWMSAVDCRHQVLPSRLLAVRHRRPKPHIYTSDEVARLMSEAALLKSAKGMKALNLETLIGLLAATGLRSGEAAALEIGDVDFQKELLVIRNSKFGKSRLVPIHKSTVEALKRYGRKRDQVFGNPCNPYFFVTDQGTALDLGAVRSWFCKVSRGCGLRKKAEGHRSGRGPRLQDLRHSFATWRLIEWYRAGLNVSSQMPKLATYLGHSSVACTYWYVEAVPELLGLATDFQLKAVRGGRR